MNWQQSKTLQCDLILRVDFIVTDDSKLIDIAKFRFKLVQSLAFSKNDLPWNLVVRVLTIFLLVALEGLVANKKTIMLKKLGNH